MVVVVTRNAPGRYRGFLASCLLEIAPGAYISPSINAATRERIWDVCEDWSSLLPEDGSVLMAWRDKAQSSGIAMKTLGVPKTDLVSVDGLFLARRDLPEKPLSDSSSDQGV